MILNYTVKEKNLTVNSILKNKLEVSSRLFTKLISKKMVSLNGIVCDTREYTKIGDIIYIDFNYFEDNSNIVPIKMDLNIIYEDEALLILNKPSGIPVHPSILHYEHSLSNGVKYYFDSINLHKKIRPVNRLDNFTSGLVVFAKNEYVQENLIRQMNSNTFEKEYIAVVEGVLDKKCGTISKPIAREPNSIIKRCIDENGQTAITHFEVLKEFDKYSLVKCILKTGRTHQIRVHFSSIGHPLLSDTLYGTKSDLIDRQALHAYKICFLHPITNLKQEFIASIPFDINRLIN